MTETSAARPGEEAIARYRARGSDALMVRWVTPIVVVFLIIIGILSGSTIGIAVFTIAAIVAAGRWLWVVMIGPRPLAFEVDLLPDELHVRTLARSIVMPLRHVRTLASAGLRARPKGPRALATDGGTFTLYPEAPGFEGLVAGLRTTVPGFEVVVTGEVGASSAFASTTGTDTPGSAALRRGSAASADDSSGLVPGVVAVRVYGSQMLADAAVSKLATAGITGLTLPAEGTLGGIRLTVQEEDHERAEAVLDS